jgi:molecular chaperone DnaK
MGPTIDCGIDLGTTNSVIAVQRGVQTDILNDPNGPLIPSVVHVESDGIVSVGRAAVERSNADRANTAIEFKRLMGTREEIVFPASGRRMTPVQLSAEVLRHVLTRTRVQSSEPIQAAVITIPAMFQLAQCEATREASLLAGLKYAPLLQEPIAAAIASAGSADLRDGYWLVYDLGGGTFDITLVRARGGRLQVVDHDGDNQLGGKDFDRALLRDAANRIRDAGLPSFRASNTEYDIVFARLKAEAERVRTALSDVDHDEFKLDSLATAEDGTEISLEYQIEREELEHLIRPIILRTVQICKDILNRNRLAHREVKRLVLVGGPTLTPCLPKILSVELGMDARHYVNPSLAVAHGAAIYAATQRIPSLLRDTAALNDGGRLRLDLTYESMTNDMQPLLAGKVIGERASGVWQVVVISQNAVQPYAAVPICSDGTFVASLTLQPGILNSIEVKLLKDDIPVEVADGTFSIIHGTSIAKPVLSQSVGVILADNSVRWYLRKGALLPARDTVVHLTTRGLRRGQSGIAVQVPLIQGENERGNRNPVIGVLRIGAEDLPCDLPIGSEVVVTLAVDEHSATAAQAYVPALERTYSEVVKFGVETRKAEILKGEVEHQRNRLAELAAEADSLENAEGQNVSGEVSEIERLLQEGGSDDISQADHMLKRLTSLVDSIEDDERFDKLDSNFRATSETVQGLLAPNDKERGNRLTALQAEFRDAMAAGDLRLANAKYKAVDDLEHSLLLEMPEFWVQIFEQLVIALEPDPRAQAYILEGRIAVKKDDLSELKTVCFKLIELLPKEQKEALSDVTGG